MKRALSALLAAPLLLTACTNQPAELGAIEHVSELQTYFEGTEWECTYWYEYSEKYAACRYPDGISGEGKISINSNPEMYSAVKFDAEKDLDHTIIGENWTYACHDLDAATCGDIADALGGELISRGHWSN